MPKNKVKVGFEQEPFGDGIFGNGKVDQKTKLDLLCQIWQNGSQQLDSREWKEMRRHMYFKPLTYSCAMARKYTRKGQDLCFLLNQSEYSSITALISL